jgi:hypothetical protein
MKPFSRPSTPRLALRVMRLKVSVRPSIVHSIASTADCLHPESAFALGYFLLVRFYQICHPHHRWFPSGIKRERGAWARHAHQAAAAPATVSGEPSTGIATGSFAAPGKAVEGGDTRARTSATSNGSRASAQAGCPGVNVEFGRCAVSARARAERKTAKGRG